MEAAHHRPLWTEQIYQCLLLCLLSRAHTSQSISDISVAGDVREESLERGELEHVVTVVHGAQAQLPRPPQVGGQDLPPTAENSNLINLINSLI